jgi:hypothetical protein
MSARVVLTVRYRGEFFRSGGRWADGITGTGQGASASMTLSPIGRTMRTRRTTYPLLRMLLLLPARATAGAAAFLLLAAAFEVASVVALGETEEASVPVLAIRGTASDQNEGQGHEIPHIPPFRGSLRQELTNGGRRVAHSRSTEPRMDTLPFDMVNKGKSYSSLVIVNEKSPLRIPP